MWNVNKLLDFLLKVLIVSFRLTMWNVNETVAEIDVNVLARFRLTMWNVNIAADGDRGKVKGVLD